MCYKIFNAFFCKKKLLFYITHLKWSRVFDPETIIEYVAIVMQYTKSMRRCRSEASSSHAVAGLTNDSFSRIHIYTSSVSYLLAISEIGNLMGIAKYCIIDTLRQPSLWLYIKLRSEFKARWDVEGKT